MMFLRKTVCYFTAAIFLMLTLISPCVAAHAEAYPYDDNYAVINDPPATLLIGDADRDGRVTTMDALVVMRYVMGIANDIDGLGFACSDVDCDGNVYATDALLILRARMGLSIFTGSRKVDFLNSLFQQMGKPYVRGGSGPDVFDCSGLAYYCLNESGYPIGRWTAAAYAGNEDWVRIGIIGELKPGDLMFFKTSSDTNVSHMGVYIGDDMLIHASYSQQKVVIATMTSWFVTNFYCGRRVDF